MIFTRKLTALPAAIGIEPGDEVRWELLDQGELGYLTELMLDECSNIKNRPVHGLHAPGVIVGVFHRVGAAAVGLLRGAGGAK